MNIIMASFCALLAFFIWVLCCSWRIRKNAERNKFLMLGKKNLSSLLSLTRKFRNFAGESAKRRLIRYFK